MARYGHVTYQNGPLYASGGNSTKRSSSYSEVSRHLLLSLAFIHGEFEVFFSICLLIHDAVHTARSFGVIHNVTPSSNRILTTFIIDHASTNFFFCGQSNSRYLSMCQHMLQLDSAFCRLGLLWQTCHALNRVSILSCSSPRVFVKV